MLNLEELLNEFFKDYLPKEENIEIYNEFSLQHELGIFLRSKINGYKVQFERNVSFFKENPPNFKKKPPKTIKKEIDICIYNKEKTEKYAIELKFPRNGQVPEQMYSFIKDIKFMEELRSQDFGFCGAACITLVDDALFYDGPSYPDKIYTPFRVRAGSFIPRKVYKPTGSEEARSQFIELNGSYMIHWQSLGSYYSNRFSEKTKFYIVTI
ncbi:TPA: hypothetical protein ACU21B_001315 [Mannheimia haemolytica]